MSPNILAIVIICGASLCQAQAGHPGPQHKIETGCDQQYNFETGSWECEGAGGGDNIQYECYQTCSHGCNFSHRTVENNGSQMCWYPGFSDTNCDPVSGGHYIYHGHQATPK